MIIYVCASAEAKGQPQLKEVALFIRNKGHNAFSPIDGWFVGSHTVQDMFDVKVVNRWALRICNAVVVLDCQKRGVWEEAGIATVLQKPIMVYCPEGVDTESVTLSEYEKCTTLKELGEWFDGIDTGS